VTYRDGPTGVDAVAVRERAPHRREQRQPQKGWVVDVTFGPRLHQPPPTLAIDVVNLFDAQYAYRLFNGFNGSHWAPGRSVYLRASVHF
jgi:outer membrane receptor protein involved in Fe transport